MIADHRRNLGRVGKVETLLILQICPCPYQTIGDIYDFEFMEQLGNGKNPDRLEFSRHIKARLNENLNFTCAAAKINLFITLKEEIMIRQNK